MYTDMHTDTHTYIQCRNTHHTHGQHTLGQRGATEKRDSARAEGSALEGRRTFAESYQAVCHAAFHLAWAVVNLASSAVLPVARAMSAMFSRSCTKEKPEA